jgi:hypothetical protein
MQRSWSPVSFGTPATGLLPVHKTVSSQMASAPPHFQPPGMRLCVAQGMRML